VGRGIKPDHLGLGEPLDEQLGRVARPAAEIEHAGGAIERHLRDEIARGPCAVVLELEILASGPVVHDYLFALVCNILVVMAGTSPGHPRLTSFQRKTWMPGTTGHDGESGFVKQYILTAELLV